ncbi:unnamed protein product [Schistosoma rodhaini]|uniref:Uncharacterized protein n=1 Tax=Schistosoma rodhaini TaxID=6188 RepID=A0AA85G2V8_9TREM|nr:unnamed protein product [Schistosoma rodhaini]
MFAMGRLWGILGLFLILTVNCQPSVNSREYPNTAQAVSEQFMHQEINANTPSENLDAYSTYSSSVVSDGNHISHPTGKKPSYLDSSHLHEASPRSQDPSSLVGESIQYTHGLSKDSEPQKNNIRISSHDSISNVAKHDHNSNVYIDEARGSNHDSSIVNQDHDQSGPSHDVYTSMHKKTTRNAQQIPPAPNNPLPDMSREQQPNPAGQSHDINHKDIVLDSRLSHGQVPGARINQPPTNYFHNGLGSMVSNHGPELSERRHFHADKEPRFRDPNENTGSRSQWETGDQSSPHDKPKRSRRDTSSEYHLDEIFSLPSREDPIQNQADFVSLVVIVPPGVKHCYFYKPITNFDVEYQVLKGGHLDIGIFIRDPEGEPITIRPPLSDSQVSISVPKYFRLMPYAICLDNRKANANLNWDNPSELERQAIETLRNNPLVNSQAQAASAEHAENIDKLMH